MQVQAMGMSRKKWSNEFRTRFEGALGEYAKIKYAEMVGLPDYWSDEVKRLMKKVEVLFSPIQHTDSSFDRFKAAAEAFVEASAAQHQLTSARNEIAALLDRDDKIKLLKSAQARGLDSADLSVNLLSEYLPQADQILAKVR